MTDISVFGEAGFDAKAWINDACKGRPAHEPLDRFLAELEMKLQLSAEEVEASLQDASAAAMRRIPYAVGEIHRLRGDIGGLQDTVRGLTGRLAADSSAAAAAVAPIAALSGVAGRMESACSTLREAAELSSAFVRVEEAFAAGELTRVAELLAAMGRSLDVVGSVPEFAQGKERLAALQGRLVAAVEGDLSAALAADDAPRLAAAAGVLLAIGRGSALQAAYVASRAPRAAAAWDAATSAPGAGSWLLAWSTRLLELLEGEGDRLAGCLPGQAPSLVAALAEAALRRQGPLVSRRLEEVGSLPALAALQQEMRVLVSGLARVVEADGSGAADLMRLALDPMEAQISRYGRLEAAHLASELGSAVLIDPANDDLDAAVAALAAGLAPAFATLRGAVDRCAALSGGTEVRGLLTAVDGAAAQHVSRLQAAVGILTDRFDKSGGGDADVSVMLSLVRLAGALSAQLATLEASVRAAIATTVPRLQSLAAAGGAAAAASDAAGAGAGGAAELLAARLAAFPAKLAPLAKLAAAAAEPRFLALPGAHAAVDGAAAAIGDAVYSALLAPVRRALEPFPSLREWRAPAGGGTSAGGVQLPSFSAYPLPYVTQVGEWLMSLPQALEALIVDDEGGDAAAADGDELAAEWLDKVVTGAGQLLLEAMMQLDGVSDPGGMQLAADAEYVCNVMSALSVAPAPGLLTVQLFAGQPPDAFADAASAAVVDGGADVRVLRALARMRGLGWQPPPQPSAGQEPQQQQQQQPKSEPPPAS